IHRISTSRIGITKGALPYCHLALIKASSSDIKVRVTVANPSQESIGIAEWGLPRWNNLTSSLFEVDRDGTNVEYRGIMMKRSMEPGDILPIEPGTEESVRVSLVSAGYDVRGHGKFLLEYRFMVLSGGEGMVCTSNALVVQK